jgi:hypothetical protein
MAGDSNHCLPLEAAIANKNSKCIFFWLQNHILYTSIVGHSEHQYIHKARRDRRGAFQIKKKICL